MLLSNYYFDKADNQITKLENYDSSFVKLRKVLMAHEKAMSANAPVAMTDVVLLACGSQDGTVQRVRDLLSRLPQDACLLIGRKARDAEWAKGFDQIDDSRLVRAETADIDDPANSFEATMLRMALARRRSGADLAILTQDALPDTDWLNAFAQSAQAVPDGGILVGRRIFPGKRPEVERVQPFAARSLDVCLTLSAVQANIVTPLMDPVAHVSEISGFDPFCALIRSDVAADMPVDSLVGRNLDTILQEIVDLTRFYLKRRVLYCARTRVREIREF